MNKLRTAFVEHPESVGETYWQHLGTALSFAGAMGLAALAAVVHGVFPFLLVRTGSATVSRLHQRMVLQRSKAPAR